MDLELCQEIVIKTYDFWNCVTMARDILNTESDELEKDREITNLEPEPSGNTAYIEFYKDKYKNSQITFVCGEVPHDLFRYCKYIDI